jgi:hypothetical protein
MNRATRLALLITFVAISFAVAWDFTPRTSSRNNAKVEVGTSGLTSKSGSDHQGSFAAKSLNSILAESTNGPIPQPTITVDDPPDGDDDDPDLPPGMAGRIDKEAYLRARGDYIDMLVAEIPKCRPMPAKKPSNRWKSRKVK